ncbi:MAG: hypothetical protein K1X74_04480 [Pirellulales bacterium]|nr:hypothetical protein [Pirellulales bacterium]
MEIFYLNHNGLKRRYLVHLPQGRETQANLPLVLAFHGGAGRADSQVRQSLMNDTSDQQGFIVAYPDGTGRAGFLTWNAGTCCGYAIEHQIDDVGFTAALIDQLQQQYKIDPKGVYATGMSNGGMLCYRLACELSDRIAAIAPVACALHVNGPQPKRPVPICHFHGLKDPNVLFQGGLGPNQLQKTPHRSNAETLGFFIKAYGLSPQPTDVHREQDYILERYEPAPGQGGAPIWLYKLPEGGHTWPGGVDITARFNTGKLIASVKANTLMWEFFQHFTTDGPVGGGR